MNPKTLSSFSISHIQHHTKPQFDQLSLRALGRSSGTLWRSYLEGTVHQLDANRLTHLHKAPYWDAGMGKGTLEGERQRNIRL